MGLSLVSAAAGLRESHDDVVTGVTLPTGLVVNAEARGGDGDPSVSACPGSLPHNCYASLLRDLSPRKDRR